MRAHAQGRGDEGGSHRSLIPPFAHPRPLYFFPHSFAHPRQTSAASSVVARAAALAAARARLVRKREHCALRRGAARHFAALAVARAVEAGSAALVAAQAPAPAPDAGAAAVAAHADARAVAAAAAALGLMPGA